MFRASQIYGRDRPTPAAAAPSNAGKGTSGSWGTAKGNGKGAWRNWDDQRERDQYRSQVSAWGTDWSWSEPSWQEDVGWASSPTGSSSRWAAPPRQLQPPRQHQPPRPKQQPPRPQGAPNWRPQADRGATQPAPGVRMGGTTLRADATSQLTTLNTITLHGSALSTVGEQALSDACQKVAIDGGFSVHEHLHLPLTGCAYVEFPHHSAAVEFLQATNGKLKVGDKEFQVKHPRGQGQIRTPESLPEARRGETPTDTLVLRGIGEMSAAVLGEAFKQLTPRLKSVKVHKDYAGQYKGLGWVVFDEIAEADLVYQRIKREGSIIAGRRVSIEFQEPNTIEGIVELEARKEKSKASLEAARTQALSGPNSDMWANYLAMFQAPEPAEPSAKRAKLETDDTKLEAGEQTGWLGLS